MGFQCKPHGGGIRRKEAVASSSKQDWCLVSSSSHGHKCNIFCFANLPEVFSLPSCWSAQKMTVGQQVGQVHSVWAPQRWGKEGGPDKLAFTWAQFWYGIKRPFPHIEYSETDQGIDLCKYKCEKLGAAKAVLFGWSFWAVCPFYCCFCHPGGFHVRF